MADASVFHGSGMTDHEIDQFLREQGAGVLALAHEGDAYAVPLSFGYDGAGTIYLDLLRFGDESEKLDHVEATETACFVTYDAPSQSAWRSVVAFGTLERVPEGDATEEMDAVMADNAWYPDLLPQAEPVTEVVRYRFSADGVTGRQAQSG
jgi:hypothetical protein